MSNAFLASQFSGPLIQLTIDTICGEYDLPEAIANYYRDITIENALMDDLYNIGLWIGLPWPTASTEAFDGTAFIFGTSATFPVIDNLQGFGTVSDPTIGGHWASVNPQFTQFIPIAAYRILLAGFAYAKYHGITLKTIDILAKVFSDNYLIGPLPGDDLFTFGSGSDPVIDLFEGFSDDGGTFGGDLSSDSTILAGDWDIHLVFLTNIGPGNLWIIQHIFDTLCTDTQVICSIDV